jgi:hypothetical protein
LREIAIRHADRTMDLFFRPDGSTWHVVDLDPAYGQVLRKHTNQGKSADSTWSRGQAWAVYGFGYMYQATGFRRYLDTAMMAADYHLARTPADHVPPADFDGGLDGLAFKDSSAAAIMASAFLRIHSLVDTPSLRNRYCDAALEILRSLTSPPYFSDGDGHAGMLRHSARNHCTDADDRLTDTSLIWADYYLLEAVIDIKSASLST